MGSRPRRVFRTVLGILGLLFVGCVAVCTRPCVPSSGGLPLEVSAVSVDAPTEPAKRRLQLEGGERSLVAVFEASHPVGDVIAVSAHLRGERTVEIRLERVLSTSMPMNCEGTTRYELTIGGLEAGPYQVVVADDDRELFSGDTEVHASSELLARGDVRRVLAAPPCA